MKKQKRNQSDDFEQIAKSLEKDIIKHKTGRGGDSRGAKAFPQKMILLLAGLVVLGSLGTYVGRKLVRGFSSFESSRLSSGDFFTNKDYNLTDLRDEERADFPWTLDQFMSLKGSSYDFRVKGTTLNQVLKDQGKADKIGSEPATSYSGERLILTYYAKDYSEAAVHLTFQKHQSTYYLEYAYFEEYTDGEDFKTQEVAKPIGEADYKKLLFFQPNQEGSTLSLTEASRLDEVLALLGYPKDYDVNIHENRVSLYATWNYPTGDYASERAYLEFEKAQDSDTFYLTRKPTYDEMDGKTTIADDEDDDD